MKQDLKKVDSILDETIEAVSEGRDEIFKISESYRMELYQKETELDKTKKLIKHIISEIDELEKSEKIARNLYMAVSKEPDNFKREEIEDVFAKVNHYQTELSKNRMLEKDLISKRTTLEFQIKNARDVIKRTEALTHKMGSALDYLSGTLMKELKDANINRNMGVEVIKAQEQERKRISREIHDGPAQQIASLAMTVDFCEKLIEKDAERAKNELSELKRLIRDSVKDIRRIIFDLMPMSLEDLGLIPTVAHYISNLNNRVGMEVNFTYNKATIVNIPNVVRLSSFRIIQESLNNSLKHSQASRVDVHIEVDKDKLEIIVKDDGVGFSKSSLESDFNSESGFGLYGIKERVRLLDGKQQIYSIDEGIDGCKIKVELPLK